MKRSPQAAALMYFTLAFYFSLTLALGVGGLVSLWSPPLGWSLLITIFGFMFIGLINHRPKR
jgi:hypothetical protein